MNQLIELVSNPSSNPRVVTLRLNRPDRRNALTRQMLQQLVQAVEAVSNDPEARLLVIQSSGPVFCAGMDLSEMQQRAAADDKEQQWQLDSEIYCQLLETLFTLKIPTLAQVQGPVLAGGVGIVLACDLIVATENTFFALPEPVRGITAAMVTPFLVYRVGAGVAGQWLLSGERVSAQRAHQTGICLDVTPQEVLESRCEALIKSVLSGSPSALAITKKHLSDGAANNVIAQARASISVSAVARQTDDAREGLAAFLEKRNPNWFPS